MEITLQQVIDDAITRDRVKERLIDNLMTDSEIVSESLSEQHNQAKDEMALDIEDLECEVESLKARLSDAYDDARFLDNELHEVNKVIDHASREMDVLVADFDLIMEGDLDNAKSWADEAYDLMREIGNEIPVYSPSDFGEPYTDEDVDYSDYSVSYFDKDYEDSIDSTWDGMTEQADYAVETTLEQA